MAARIGVVAVRDATAEELVASLPRLEKIGAEHANGWTWACFNLFVGAGIVGAAAERALRALNRCALQAWTEDGALWYLSVYAPAEKPFRHVHWFRYNDIASGREKPQRGQTLRAYLDEYEEDVPPEYRFDGTLPSGGLAVALRAHLRERAAALSAYLVRNGVAHDRDAVGGALTGQSVTDQEWDWDIGNLPRLLEAIGLPDVPPGWRSQLEADRAEAMQLRTAAAEAEKEPPPDLVEPILEALGDAEATPIDGGAVLTVPSTLWLLPWSADTDVELGFRVQPRPRDIAWDRIEEATVVEVGEEARVGMPWQNVGARTRVLTQLERLLLRLPTGSEVELVSAAVPEGDDEPSPRMGSMRFRGTIDHGTWRVTHAHPPATKRDLETALAILEWSSGSEPFAAHDRAEADAVVARLLKAVPLNEKDRPRIKGAAVRISKTYRPYLAQAFLRHRLAAGPWDFASAQAADEELQTSVDETIARVAAALGALGGAFAAPRGEEVVLVGERSTFRRANIAELRARVPLTDVFRMLYPTRTFEQELQMPDAVRAVDEAMGHGGLLPLGDMVCEAFGDLVLRGYGREGGACYGVLIVGTLGQFVYELYTEFTNGSSLTTSINAGKNHKEAKAFHRHFPDATVEKLFEEHAGEVARHTTKRITPASHPPELFELAKRIDAYLVRTSRAADT